MNVTQTAARFTRLITRATGVTLDPVLSMPGVVGETLRFFAPIDDTVTIVEAFVGRHGVDPKGIAVTFLDADAFELPSAAGATDAMISVDLAALTARLATLTA